MKSFAVLAIFAGFFGAVFGTPTSSLRDVTKYSGAVQRGSYIVTLKAGVNLSSARRKGYNITAEYRPDVLNGFAATLDSSSLAAILAEPNVESVEEDGIMTISATQTNGPWGIARLRSSTVSGSAGTLTHLYPYDVNVGANVDIYVLDTGIHIGHEEFEGRASWGATFGAGFLDADGNGHGTHCAGIAVSRKYGVAKYSKVVAVKVLSDGGSGTTSGMRVSSVSGINWVRARALVTGRPSIISLSLGGGISTSLDAAVTSVISAGIHVVIAAGNSNVDAGQTSPARVAAAITVGASTFTNARSSASNFGSVVDVFAPGQSITSTWIGSDVATNVLSGTSMATAHAAGVVAYLLGFSNPTISPAAVGTLIQSTCLGGTLTSIPNGTNNCLLRLATTPAPPVLPSGPL